MWRNHSNISFIIKGIVKGLNLDIFLRNMGSCIVTMIISTSCVCKKFHAISLGEETTTFGECHHLLVGTIA
jgi:hypothetical protein